MPTCYGEWNSTYRYQVNDLIGFNSTNEVFECLTSSLCQYNVTTDSGSLGWSSTFYRVPEGAEMNVPPTIYFDGSEAHQWIAGDIAKVGSTYYTCGDAIGCRCAADITTCPSWTVATMDGTEIAANTMDELASICQVQVAG